MYDLKKSDAVIVAVKQANNGRSTPCGVSGAKGRNRGEFGRLKDAPYSVCGESVMEVDRIRKAAKRNPEGCPTFRVLPAQRVGVPKPIEASRDQPYIAQVSSSVSGKLTDFLMRPLSHEFFCALALSAAKKAPRLGRNEPCSHAVTTSRSCFLERRTDLSCRFC